MLTNHRIHKAAFLKKNSVPLLLIAGLISLFVLHKPGYLKVQDTYFWMTLLSLPVSFHLSPDRKSNRYFWPALSFGLLSIPFTTTFGIYCTLIFSLLFLLEKYGGKTTVLLAIHLMLLSPIFIYLEGLVSFPVRLALSETAGHLLILAGYDIKVSGNLIVMNGNDFLIDQACSGLYMLRYGLLFGIIILSIGQKGGKKWTLIELALLFLLLFGLNILGNLVRILVLVIFKILPSYDLHEGIGLLTFILYSLLPFYFIAKKMSERKVKKELNTKTSVSKTYYLPFILLLIFPFICWKNIQREKQQYAKDTLLLASKQAEQVHPQVYKISTENALVYIKKPVEAYNADHNPLICWKGSGYLFKHIRTEQLNGMKVSTAELIKEDEKIYTMWWFDSGQYKTGSQWDWRMRSVTENESFYLINISAANYDVLIKEATLLMNQQLIRSKNLALK